jgi:hypothetical protein
VISILVRYIATHVCAVMKVRTRVCWQTYSSSKYERPAHRLERSSIGLCIAKAPINEMPVSVSLVTSAILVDISCDKYLNISRFILKRR